uniref:Uncharacterized protein n=1 Tax=Arundo donax TaxID=35708 RepID=A0A0A9G1T1_ARUDO
MHLNENSIKLFHCLCRSESTMADLILAGLFT